MPRLALLLAIFLAVGCARPGSPRPTASGADASRLLVGLGAEGGTGPSQTTVPPGGAITLVLLVENPGAAPVEVSYASGQAYDFVVSREGREVWRWSRAAGMSFTQALREARVGPGDRLVYREPWRAVDTAGQPVPAGDYEARGVVPLARGPLESPPLRITVTR